MFDIGFFEILIVGVISLLVLGPEKLPGAIRTVSLWMGRLRRSFNNIKSDIEREIGADEIRRQLRNEEIMEKFRNTQSQVQNSIKSIKKETEEFKKNVNLESQVANFMKGDKPAGDTAQDPAQDGQGKASDSLPDTTAQPVDQGNATGADQPVPAAPAPAPQPAPATEPAVAPDHTDDKKSAP